MLVAYFLVNPKFMVMVLRVAGSFALVCGYLVSVGIRITDTYKLWPATEIATSAWRPARTLRSTIGFYIYVLLVLISFWGLVFWLAG
jgi:hypothetical protein